LSKSLADPVAQRLVATGRLMDVEPQEAYRHALVAKRLAPRLASVREAVGLAAYHAGEWAAAIAELRTFHRLTGQPTHLAVIADSERALGRPERALEVYRSADLDALAPADSAELLIVAAGARADLGQLAAALAMLQGPASTEPSTQPWVSRLRYAYADLLLAAGRGDEARDWFAKAAELDEELATDAAQRLLDLDGVVLDDAAADEADADADEVDAQEAAADGAAADRAAADRAAADLIGADTDEADAHDAGADEADADEVDDHEAADGAETGEADQIGAGAGNIGDADSGSDDVSQVDAGSADHIPTARRAEWEPA
jgi:tetratricopeptide (TPR) repeat protein